MSLQSRIKSAGEYLRSTLSPRAIDGFEILTDDPLWGLHGRTLRRREPGEKPLYEKAQIRDHTGHSERALEAYRDEGGRIRVRSLPNRERERDERGRGRRER